MAKKEQRMAGDKVAELYGGEKEYGKWGDTWDHGAEQQQMKAAGKYDKDSDLAKQFSGMKENISSRVDDEDGWRQLDIDGSLKDPKAYEDLVNKWSKAGFDVRAIDMADGFHSSNIAVRMASGDGTGVEDPVGGGGDDDGGGGGGGGGNETGGGGGTTQTITNTSPSGGMTQNVNQDNDITNTITGSNNTVTNNQDNSVKQFGGSGSWKDAWMTDYFA